MLSYDGYQFLVTDFISKRDNIFIFFQFPRYFLPVHVIAQQMYKNMRTNSLQQW